MPIGAPILEVVCVSNCASPEHMADTCGVEHRVSNTKYRTVPILGQTVQLGLPGWSNNVDNAVVLANARKDESLIASAVGVSFDRRALVATPKFPPGVSPNFLDDVAVEPVKRDEAFEGLLAFRFRP